MFGIDLHNTQVQRIIHVVMFALREVDYVSGSVTCMYAVCVCRCEISQIPEAGSSLLPIVDSNFLYSYSKIPVISPLSGLLHTLTVCTVKIHYLHFLAKQFFLQIIAFFLLKYHSGTIFLFSAQVRLSQTNS